MKGNTFGGYTAVLKLHVIIHANAFAIFKTKFIRKLSNSNFQWTKTLYQNILSHIAFFFTLFKDYECNKLYEITPKRKAQPRPQGAFPSKPREKRPGDEVEKSSLSMGKKQKNSPLLTQAC